jgi:seryl-tRNA synthetase
MIYRFRTADRLTKHQAEMLISKLIYSVEGISDCRLEDSTKDIVLQVTDEQTAETLEAVFEQLVKQEKGIRRLGKRVLKETSAAGMSPPALSEAELEAVYARDGSVRRDLAVLLAQAFSEQFLNLAIRHQALLRQYPSLIRREALAKCRYVETFPQNVWFVSEFPHQLEVLEQVRNTPDWDGRIRPNEFILSPAVCFHCYEELSGQVLSGPLLLTAQGECFRHEAPWRVGTHRMFEFSMREIVFFGSPDFVKAARDDLLENVWGLFGDLGLSGRIETAFDPFYFPEDGAKAIYQLMDGLKYELVATVQAPSGQIDSFAVASFNDCKEALCKAYDIRDLAGGPLHSGCVAFGIDRWVYAFLSVYGTDVEDWPASVIERLRFSELKKGRPHV